MRGSLPSPIATERAVTKDCPDHCEKGTAAWHFGPRASLPASTILVPALVSVDTAPVRFHPCSPLHENRKCLRIGDALSGMHYRTDKEKAGKDARGPGWNPLPRIPGRVIPRFPFPRRAWVATSNWPNQRGVGTSQRWHDKSDKLGWTATGRGALAPQDGPRSTLPD